MSSKTYFEENAQDWDVMRHAFFPESVREKAFASVGIQEDAIVADIGAGTGFITEGLLNQSIKIIAMDQSPKMLEVMAAKFADQSNVEYRLGESESLPFQDNEVDFAFANMYLHHVENPEKSIAELYRILKPGGKLVITDLDKHNHEFLIKEHKDRWMGFEREDLKAWYAKSGFSRVNIDCVGDNCCADAEQEDDKAEISIFIAVGTKF